MPNTNIGNALHQAPATRGVEPRDRIKTSLVIAAAFVGLMAAAVAARQLVFLAR